MSKYRKVIKTEKSGKNWFYVQKKWFFFFWRYLYRSQNTQYASRICFDKEFEADAHIQKCKKQAAEYEQCKTVKTEYKNFD